MTFATHLGSQPAEVGDIIDRLAVDQQLRHAEIVERADHVLTHGLSEADFISDVVVEQRINVVSVRTFRCRRHAEHEPRFEVTEHLLVRCGAGAMHLIHVYLLNVSLTSASAFFFRLLAPDLQAPAYPLNHRFMVFLDGKPKFIHAQRGPVPASVSLRSAHPPAPSRVEVDPMPVEASHRHAHAGCKLGLARHSDRHACG